MFVIPMQRFSESRVQITLRLILPRVGTRLGQPCFSLQQLALCSPSGTVQVASVLGAAQLTIKAGNVGIGTANPGQALDVAGKGPNVPCFYIRGVCMPHRYLHGLQDSMED